MLAIHARKSRVYNCFDFKKPACPEGGHNERQAKKVTLEPLELRGKEHSLKTIMHISYKDGKHEDGYT